MIETKWFGEQLKSRGFDFFTGVPCSFLKDLINYAINECEYVGAANEGDAVAIASGAYLGGRKAVVLMQNSGLTNAVSPLTSLNYIFKLPVLGFVSLRGEAGVADEPQHELMGQITTELLSLMRIQWEYLADTAEEAAIQLQRADKYISRNETFFFVVKKGTFGKEQLQPQTLVSADMPVDVHYGSPADEVPSRHDILQVLTDTKDEQTIHLATTGFTGRELYEVDDSEQNLYMVGSMGCISSLGLGISMTRPEKKVVAIDGDGALLMRMGNMATVAHYGQSNLLHLLLDNQRHDSTGGQATVSAGIDFALLASACGYKRTIVAYTAEQFRNALVQWKESPELTFIHVPISGKATENLGRPHIKPYEVKERIMEFIR